MLQIVSAQIFAIESYLWYHGNCTVSRHEVFGDVYCAVVVVAVVVCVCLICVFNQTSLPEGNFKVFRHVK